MKYRARPKDRGGSAEVPLTREEQEAWEAANAAEAEETRRREEQAAANQYRHDRRAALHEALKRAPDDDETMVLGSQVGEILDGLGTLIEELRAGAPIDGVGQDLLDLRDRVQAIKDAHPPPAGPAAGGRGGSGGRGR